ncbi:MAG: lysophospholipid acyltransferase family protein [Deltaproteobacteria bacterium]|nr:lysophospholipid acyltransferase family protein [Deltaproteobacteria bacterium]
MNQAAEARSQAPEVGFSRRLLGPFHITGVFWFKFHHWGISILPSWAMGIFVVLFTTFFFLVLRRIRRAIASNLEAALGPCSWWQRQVRIYRSMWNFAWCLTESYEQKTTDRPLTVTVEGDEGLEDLHRDGQGFVLVTAHVGHWEVGALRSPRYKGWQVHVVREEEMDPKAQEFVLKLYENRGDDRVKMYFSPHATNVGVTLLAALRRGEIVALQGDRPPSGGRTVTAELFGRPIELPVGPVSLGRAAEVPLVPSFVFRAGRSRSRVVFRPPIQVAHTKNRQEDLQEAVQKVVAEVEAAILEAPYQWFCFRELWPGK